jgi:hypothetical protein
LLQIFIPTHPSYKNFKPSGTGVFHRGDRVWVTFLPKTSNISNPYPSLNMISFNYHRLQTLRCSDASQTLGALAQLLALCPNLEVCDVEYLALIQDLTLAAHSITLPCLRSISLMWIVPFLATLQIPTLTYCPWKKMKILLNPVSHLHCTPCFQALHHR